MDTQTANSMFEKHGFLYAKTMLRGTLSECLSYPNIFKTTIPQADFLPELEGNICEGVVIRPIRPSFLKNGARVIIKNKKWAENNNYIDQTVLRKLLRKNNDELSEEAGLLCEEIYRLITRNRLDNLIGKLGNVVYDRDFGKLLGLYKKDVLVDFLKSYRAQYENLEKNEIKTVNKFLNKYSIELINTHFDKNNP